MVDDHLCPVPVSLYLGSADFPAAPKALCHICVDHIQIEGILPKGPYLPCVSMGGRALLVRYLRDVSCRCMQITLSNQIGNHANEYPACNYWKYCLVLCTWASSEEMAIIIAVSQGATQKVLQSVCDVNSLTQGLCGHRLNTINW